MPKREHIFGIVIFVPMTMVKEGERSFVSTKHDEEDPFCYHCGQKYINAKDTECPGPSKHSRNVFVRDYSI